MQLEGTKMPIDVKTIGSSGQISLGKEYAGRTVAVEEVEQGVWIIKSARVIPENELWLHTPSASKKITRATEWAEKNPPKESNPDEIEHKPRRRRKSLRTDVLTAVQAVKAPILNGYR